VKKNLKFCLTVFKTSFAVNAILNVAKTTPKLFGNEPT
jgi:hypothetical protein